MSRSEHFAPILAATNDDMRLPEPRRVISHGNVRWLVRTPKAMGGGREYCESKEAAQKRIAAFEKAANSTHREFTALHRSDQAMLLGLLAQFDGDVPKLKAAAEAGLSKVASNKLVSEAVEAFKADHSGGIIRKGNIGFYLSHFCARFKDETVSEVEALELQRWMDSRGWGPKTFNDCRQVLGQFWKYCIRRKWAVTSPVTDIPVKKVPRHKIAIYTPDELQKMLAGAAKACPELVPLIAIGAFAGLRNSEIGRLTCEQVLEALKTGHLEISAEQAGKTSQARTVPMLRNLKAWLKKYLPKSGTVLPKRWMQPTKTKSNRLDELGRYVRRKTGVAWKSNGLRHSFGTYRFKIVNDVAQVVDEMGTSIQNFERHYRARSKIVTAKSASDYFKRVGGK